MFDYLFGHPYCLPVTKQKLSFFVSSTLLSIFMLTVVVSTQSHAQENFDPKWDETVETYEIARPTFISNSKMLIAYPTKIKTSTACSNIVFQVALEKSTESYFEEISDIRKRSEFRVEIWTSNGQNLGLINNANLANPLWSPSQVTQFSARVCPQNFRPGDSVNLDFRIYSRIVVLSSSDQGITFTKTATLNYIQAKKESQVKEIICVKGNLTKKVKALNPKCPPGYKKK